MNTSNSNRLAFMVLGLVVVATTAVNAQQQRFSPTQQSPQYSKLGIQTTFQQYGIKNGTVANFGERINNVRPGSPGARTGLEAGDIIVGFYLGHSYRKISRQTNLEFAISSARGNLRVKVINYRNGQFVNATIRFNAGNGQGGYGQGGNGQGGYGQGGNGQGGYGQGGNGQGGYGTGAGGPEVHDHRTVPYPTMPPPAPKYQNPTARAGYVWIQGNYKWRKENGGSYVWSGGHWEGARANNAAWIPGYWFKQGNRWVWTAGRWTKAGLTITGKRR
jgi:hypothetical protein